MNKGNVDTRNVKISVKPSNTIPTGRKATVVKRVKRNTNSPVVKFNSPVHRTVKFILSHMQSTLAAGELVYLTQCFSFTLHIFRSHISCISHTSCLLWFCSNVTVDEC